MIYAAKIHIIRYFCNDLMMSGAVTCRNAARMVILLTCLLLLASKNTQACTIFCISMDGMVLAGNNEDWEDPDTRFWIYPPEGGKHGWIKFGFGSGFPQGGMNDRGLFWDATAGPHMDMPASEANKSLYHGPLMQKVIEECSSMSDALELFNAYYCEDQYKAQYLVGDSTGHSMIVEGDSILHRDIHYQVLTNFYQSDPDLGGYPCWRYEKAVEMLGQCGELNLHFAGTVLASTHQEGRYPTQYSGIYDLRNQVVYLFYFHHYQEFLVIDLHEEMKKGTTSREIPALFSRVSILGPHDGDTMAAGSVTVHWMGLQESHYSVVYSENPDLSDSRSVEATRRNATRPEHPVLPLAFSFYLVVPLLILTGKKTRGRILLFIVALSLLGIRCEKEEEPEEKAVEFSRTLNNLEPGTRYYWKIVAMADPSGRWSTETIIQTLVTADE